jgi:hypothetical protein
MIGIEPIEQCRGCRLGFIEIDGPVIVGVERLERTEKALSADYLSKPISCSVTPS